MRFASVILLLIFMHSSIGGYSQTVTLSEKGTSLEKIFKKIESQTGYYFVYRDEWLKKSEPITIEVKNMALKEVLDICFRNQPLSYAIVDKLIVVKQKQSDGSNVVRNSGSVVQSVSQLQGVVKDNTGQPLEGAIINVKGTNTNTVTDINGRFTLSAASGQILVVSFVGYNSAEFKVGSTQNIAINMVPKREDLSNVTVVSTGYQKISKDRSAGSISIIQSDAIQQKTVSMNVMDRLEGLVAGLTVNNSPGADKFLMRGLSTIFGADRQPLVVVDGVPLYSGEGENASSYASVESLINPNDVESVSFLKDATAASIWGAAAANGVIVITTKKGSNKGRKPVISYNGFVTVKGMPDLNYGRYMNSSQLLQSAQEIFAPTTITWGQITTAGSGNIRPVVTPHEQILYDQYNQVISQDEANEKLDSLSWIDNRGQLNRYLRQNAVTSNHSVTVNGGNEMHTYYGSLAYTKEKYTSRSDLDRFQLNLRQDFNFSKSIKFDITTNLSYELGKDFLLTDLPASSNLPYVLFKDEGSGKNLSLAYLLRYEPFRLNSEELSRISLDYIPLEEPGKTNNKSENLSARVNAGLSLKLFKGMTYEGRGQYQRASVNNFEYYDNSSYRVRNENMLFTQRPATAGGPPVYFLPVTGGHYITNNNVQTAWTVRNQLLYDNALSGQHYLNVLGGTEVRSSLYTPQQIFRRGYNYQTQQYELYNEKDLALNGVTNPVEIRTSGAVNTLNSEPVRFFREIEKRYFSLYSNLSYSYAKKYTFNGSVRMDQSNLFGSDRSAQYKPVWSLGGAWAMSKEEFLRNKGVNNLVLRLTYGIGGNAPNPGDGGPYDIVRGQNSSIYSGLGPGYMILTPANNRLVWEQIRTINAGLDFALFNSRLSGSLDVYNKKSSNLLGFAPVDPTSGWTFVYSNLGSMSNKGFELSVNTRNVAGKNFTWNSMLTISRNSNFIIELKRGLPLSFGTKLGGQQLEGYPAYPLFGFNFAGLNSQGNPVALAENGDSIFLSSQVQTEDAIYAGTRQPIWSGGLTNILAWKNISLSFLLIYNFGHQMRKDVNQFYTGRLNSNYPDYFLNRWKKPGDEDRTDIPRYEPSTSLNSSLRYTNLYTQSMQNIVSAAYVKMRDVTVTYNFSEQVLKKLKIANLSMYAQVNNILIWTKNKYGIDPEYHDLLRGERGARMPAFYSLGIKTSF